MVRWSFYSTPVFDLLIVILLFIWAAITLQQWNWRISLCSEQCSNCVGNCQLYSTTDSSYDSYVCTSCTDQQCDCYPSQRFNALYVSYFVFFSFAMAVETVKLWIAVCITANGIKPDCECKNCHHQIADSWAILGLFTFAPRAFLEIKNLEDKGELPTWSAIKCVQWIFRDMAMVIIIGLELGETGFTPWFFIYVAVVLGYWYSFRMRIQHKMEMTRAGTPGNYTAQMQMPNIVQPSAM